MHDYNDQFYDVLCQSFAEGLTAYQQHDWQAAIGYFLQTLKVCPDDGPSRYYLERCELHAQNRLPLDQNGVIVLQKK